MLSCYLCLILLFFCVPVCSDGVDVSKKGGGGRGAQRERERALARAHETGGSYGIHQERTRRETARAPLTNQSSPSLATSSRVKHIADTDMD